MNNISNIWAQKHWVYSYFEYPKKAVFVFIFTNNIRIHAPSGISLVWWCQWSGQGGQEVTWQVITASGIFECVHNTYRWADRECWDSASIVGGWEGESVAGRTSDNLEPKSHSCCWCQAFDSFDVNKDGQLSYEEFLHALCRVMPESYTLDQLRKFTSYVHVDHDGFMIMSAVGWSGSARSGARLRTKALFWGNRGIVALTWVYADLVAPTTRHRHYQSPFICTIHYPCSTNQLIWGLKLELLAAKPSCDCADCLPQS